MYPVAEKGKSWRTCMIKSTGWVLYIVIKNKSKNGNFLTLCMLGKWWHFILFLLENRIWNFMQIVSYGHILYEVSDPIYFLGIKC